MKIIFYSSLFVLICMSCSNDEELSDSTFINDPVITGLPAYSEWGYNTFGAKYDRELFLYDNNKIPIKLIVTKDTTYMNFNGKLGAGELTITLGFTDFMPDDYQDLIALDDKIVDVMDNEHFVTFTKNDQLMDITIIKGEFHFKRVQNLILDGEEEEIILSGVFECQFLLNKEPFSISKGRFDVGVGYNNFFNY